jgi:hypothetical protein
VGRSRQRPIADSHNSTARPPRTTRHPDQAGSLPDWSDLGVDTDGAGFDPDWWPTTPPRASRFRRAWWSARPLTLGSRWTRPVQRVQRLWQAGSTRQLSLLGPPGRRSLPSVATLGAFVGAVLMAIIGVLLIVDHPARLTAHNAPPPTEAGQPSFGAPQGTAGPLAVGGRVRAEPRATTPSTTTEPTAEVTPTRVVAGPPAPRVATRMDEPVLYWLPEIIDASDETGVPASLIAAVIQVESQGNPDAVSPAGARGLMQLMPSHLEEQGIDQGLWHDPETNIQAGALLLKWKIESTGNQWDGVRYYFGIKCDVYTCTEDYVNHVYAWRTHYAPLIAAG